MPRQCFSVTRLRPANPRLAFLFLGFSSPSRRVSQQDYSSAEHFLSIALQPFAKAEPHRHFCAFAAQCSARAKPFFSLPQLGFAFRSFAVATPGRATPLLGLSTLCPRMASPHKASAAHVIALPTLCPCDTHRHHAFARLIFTRQCLRIAILFYAIAYQLVAIRRITFLFHAVAPRLCANLRPNEARLFPSKATFAGRIMAVAAPC